MLTHAKISVSCPVERTARVQQVEGIFDLQPADSTGQNWDVYLPLDDQPWQIGLIVGHSGCGKSTIAKHLWPAHYYGTRQSLLWPEDQSILDALPARMPIKDLIHILSSVGFSSPPAWLRPYHVLSTG